LARSADAAQTPEVRFEKLLVLDLDETLVHATEEPLVRPPDFGVGPYAIYERPHVRPFLAHVLERFAAVAVWTASTRSYAIPVLSRLVGTECFAFVWCRDRCTRHIDWETREGEYLKDIRKLTRRGYRREAILFVDDTPAKLARSYGNLVTVQSWVGEEHDDELLHLAAYLDSLGPLPNVRTLEKRGWRRQY
jgi:RNA polymerase II subunit A small phosphatase-like protein